MTVFEMQGVLRGKAIPGDMKVNESLAEYLVRKLADAEARGVDKAIERITSVMKHPEVSQAVNALRMFVDVLEAFKKELREAR